MKYLTFVAIVIILQVFLSCSKDTASDPGHESEYIAIFEKDSISAFLGPNADQDTVGVRKKVRDYTLKLLTDRKIPTERLVNTYFFGTSLTGFAFQVSDTKALETVKADARVDYVEKSESFTGFEQQEKPE